MKRLITILFILVGFVGSVFAQARPQTYTRLRDATQPATLANVRALTLTFPATRVGLHTNSAMYFYDGANLRWMLGAQMNADNVAVTTYAPWQGAFTHGFNTVENEWARISIHAAGDTLSAAPDGLDTLSFNLFYDGANYRRWLGAQMNSDSVAVTTYAPWIGNFNHTYDATADDWERSQSTDGSAHILKEDTGIYAPAATTGVAIDDTASGTVGDPLLASTYVLDLPNWCVFIAVTAGDDLQDAYLLVGPDGTNWESQEWTACDTLSNGEMCSYCVSNGGMAYIKAEAICSTGDSNVMSVWITGNKN